MLYFRKFNFIFLGFIFGLIWFIFFEKFDQKSLNEKIKQVECWELIHYFDKKIPLFIVHMKSIIGGIILIILGYSNYKYKNEIIIFLGSVIIGLHIIQYYAEIKFINSQKISSPKK